jgi:hypothetical protein
MALPQILGFSQFNLLLVLIMTIALKPLNPIQEKKEEDKHHLRGVFSQH